MHQLFIGFFVIFSKSLFAQDSIPSTELLIIGTLHYGNKHFNHKTLFNTIKKYKPDIILSETSTNFKRVSGLLTKKRLNMINVSIEQLAVQKYFTYNNKVQIKPFDIFIDSINQYINTRTRAVQIFKNGLNAVQKSSKDSIRLQTFFNMEQNYYGFISDTTLTRINKPDIVAITRKLFLFDENFIIPMGKKYLNESVATAYEEEFKFWHKRNSYMVEQISKYLKEYKGKRIIVLVGHAHKYYLQDKLINKENDKIIVTIQPFINLI